MSITDPHHNASSFEELSFNRKTLIIEIAILLVVTFFYGKSLLISDPTSLQQSGEHTEGATLPLLADIAIQRYGELPLWNPYMMTGIPHSGDPLTQFFNPISALSYYAFGAIRGLRISVFVAFFIAGLGQLVLGYVLQFKAPTRVWAALLFMLSGGLALLWRGGVYGFIIGAAWFPLAIASLIWALKSKRRFPLALAAFASAMLFLSGLMYWPLLFLGSAFIIAYYGIIAGQFPNSSWGNPKSMLKKLGYISLLALGLVAIYLLPMTDAYTYMAKEAGSDLSQNGSQTIPYALINFAVKDFDFYLTNLLGKMPSGTWFYVSSVPLLLLVLVPLAARDRKRRSNIILFAILTIILLAWQANRHTPMGLIYKWLPFLYYFRAPNRFLVLVTVPLVSLAGFGLDYLFKKAEQIKLSVGLFPQQNENGNTAAKSLAVSQIVIITLCILAAYSVRDVFRTNQTFAFAPRHLDHNADEGMAWLKEYDPGVYYVNIGNWPIIWSWTAAAYKYEHKVINFDYGRVLQSWYHQLNPETPIQASPRYMFAFEQNAPGEPAEFIRSFNNVNLYYIPNSLPYAFTIASSLTTQSERVTYEDVDEAEARLDSTNRIVVEASSSGKNEYVVILESNYPGWKVYVDGEEQAVHAVGDFLGVKAHKGTHQYTFSFEPVKFTVGWIISLISVVITVLVGLSDKFPVLAAIPRKLISSQNEA
ncbi:MAG: YfhO family protein [Anaerolineae bacterium]|nr:YfhO family protein [Anaerolineae bacterium]